MPKKIVGIPSMFLKVWGNRKFLCIRGDITFYRQKFSVSRCQKFSWASLQCLRSFRYRKNSCVKGVSRFSVKNSLSHFAENFRGQSFSVSESFGNRKTLCIIGVSQFSLESGFSHSAEKFWEEILLFLRIFLVSKSFYGWKGGRITSSRQKVWSHSAAKTRGHLFNVSESLG